MKCMQVVEFGQPLVEAEVVTPHPTGTEVVLKIKAAGVCHTDLHLWHGGYDLGHGKRLSMQERGVKLPLIMGHENVGVVEAVGPDVQHVQVGETYLVYPWIGCGQCEVCQQGNENYCLKPSTIGINQPGGYAESVRVPHEKYLISIGQLDPVRVAPLACSGLTCYSALRKFDLKRLKNKPLVVIGAGGLGLMSISLLRALGGKGAIVIEPDASRRAAALEAGALAVVNPEDLDATEQVQALLDGPALDVLDFVSNPQTAELAFNLLTKGGHLVLVGLFGGAAPWPLPLIAMKALTIQGSYVGSLGELHELVNLVIENDISLIPVSTCNLPELKTALEDLELGKVVGRVVMTP